MFSFSKQSLYIRHYTLVRKIYNAMKKLQEINVAEGTILAITRATSLLPARI